MNLPVIDYVHKNYTTLDENMSVEEAVRHIRELKEKDESQVMYFYTVDRENRITGVLPVRKLLTADAALPLHTIAKKDIVTARSDELLLEVARKFASYKYLSIPVVDEKNCLEGVIDLRIFAQKDIDISDRMMMDEIFQTIGMRISKLKSINPLKAFQMRFPWLLTTIGGGAICAVLTSVFAMTLEKSIILTFFLTLMLGVGESVSVQSMTLSFRQIQLSDTKWRKLLKLILREAGTAILLAAACGSLIFGLAAVIGQQLLPAVTIGISIFISVCNACLIGFTIPLIFHRFKLDPKIASGPIVLALADVGSILIYLLMASVIL